MDCFQCYQLIKLSPESNTGSQVKVKENGHENDLQQGAHAFYN